MGKKSNKAAVIITILALLIAAAVLATVVILSSRGKKYDAAHFGIETYTSKTDRDGDGIDDQTDILQSVKRYLATEPKYKSVYYSDGGWPDDGYGVCTDVVARGLLCAGYNLQTLVAKDREEHPEDYKQDEKSDPNIDFRRVRNLLPYFKNNAISLTTDTSDIAAWQPGDIVVWDGHVGMISENRNKKGVPYVYHHRGVSQTEYEEDVLEKYGEILGHFRVS